MKYLAVVLAWAVVGRPVPCPAQNRSPDPQAAIRPKYQTAFQYYSEGEYARAIQLWNEILKQDGEQRTAQKMIEEARAKIEKKDHDRRVKYFRWVAGGRYRQAYLDLQYLLNEDPTHPRYLAYQSRLEKISEIIPQAPSAKAWRAAVKGLEGYVGEKENLQLALDGLRYAQDLDPRDSRFQSLLDYFESEHADLVRADPVTPGMGFMEYKRFVSLNDIYDGKYHLAIAVLDNILALEPRDALSLKRLGTAYYSLGHKAQARKIWEQALRLSPNDGELKKFLARLSKSEPQPSDSRKSSENSAGR